MRAPVLLALLALAGCREAAGPASEPVGAARVEAERAACERAGGVFASAAAGRPLICVRPTRDAGRQCRTGADCQGACLARSNTCAPFVPLFGCHEVITGAGGRVVECFE
jgi:hypothetical protein